jgi:hypothetical protein
MAIRSASTVEVPRSGVWRYAAQLPDETGAAIPAASLATLTITVYEEDLPRTFPIINGINGRNVLNANGGTVDAQGNVVIVLKGADNEVVDAATPVGGAETHVLLLQGTYGVGGVVDHEVEFTVRNVAKLT